MTTHARRRELLVTRLTGAEACHIPSQQHNVINGEIASPAQRPSPAQPHFCDCLKYLRSGGGWSFLAGINRPSALRK
jgi:hypothetical protein